MTYPTVLQLTLPSDAAHAALNDAILEGMEQIGEEKALLVQGLLDSCKLVSPNGRGLAEEAYVTVAGKKLFEGTITQMEQVFQQELASHGAPVALYVREGLQWVQRRARKQQLS